MYTPNPSSSFVLDQSSYESLKNRARQGSGQTEAEVAQQFESLFVQMMLKRMRATTFQGDLFNTQQTEMLQSVADEQLALHLSQQGGVGLADMLMQQMQRFTQARENAERLAAQGGLPEAIGDAKGLPVNSLPHSAVSASGTAASGATSGAAAAAMAGGAAGLGTEGAARAGFAAHPAATGFPAQSATAFNAQLAQVAGRAAGGRTAASGSASGAANVLQAIRHGAQVATRHAAELGRRATEVPAHVDHFVRRLGDAAESVAAATGLPVKLILAQAALESGWGRQEIRHANGLPSHNLFGIKATGGWQGGTAEVLTTEYVDGEAQRLKQHFRAYRSYEEGLHDYARLISENPRYSKVLEARNEIEAAHRVQQAGYATDPRYAQKLIAVMQLLPD